MKLLIDECLSAEVADRLAETGYDVVHVPAIGLAGRPDIDVMAAALKQRRVIVSADTDSGDLGLIAPGKGIAGWRQSGGATEGHPPAPGSPEG